MFALVTAVHKHSVAPWPTTMQTCSMLSFQNARCNLEMGVRYPARTWLDKRTRSDKGTLTLPLLILRWDFFCLQITVFLISRSWLVFSVELRWCSSLLLEGRNVMEGDSHYSKCGNVIRMRQWTRHFRPPTFNLFSWVPLWTFSSSVVFCWWQMVDLHQAVRSQSLWTSRCWRAGEDLKRIWSDLTVRAGIETWRLYQAVWTWSGQV